MSKWDTVLAYYEHVIMNKYSELQSYSLFNVIIIIYQNI